MAVGSGLQFVAVLVLTAGAVSAAPPLGRLSEAEWGSYNEIDHMGPGTYAFGYDVDDAKTGNTQFRQEERHPNGTVTGSYGLVEPDGNVRIVNYVADHLGYRVTIQNTHKTRKLPSPPEQLSSVSFNTQQALPPPRPQVLQQQGYQPSEWSYAAPAHADNPYVPYSANYV